MTKDEIDIAIDNALANLQIDENELNSMLKSVLT
jgi:hypothetical protein